MKNVAVLTEDGAFALFFRPHPEGFDSSRVPTPGNLPSDNQHGFRPSRSCVTQQLQLVHEWFQALDKLGSVDAVFLDFAKAFEPSLPCPSPLQVGMLWYQRPDFKLVKGFSHVKETACSD